MTTPRVKDNDLLPASGTAIFGEGAQARVYDLFSTHPETRGDHKDWFDRGTKGIMRPRRDSTAYAAWLAGKHRALQAAEYDMTEKHTPKDDGWTEWKGGECPVPGDTMVEVLLREETATTGEAMEAGKYSWGHFGEGNRYADHDIVAYRVVKP